MIEIGVVGVNSKSCPLNIREGLTRAMERCFGGSSCDRSSFAYVLLSTCHRVEMYYSGHDIAAIHVYILATLRRELEEPFELYLYSFFESDVFLHLGKVTCGLDSSVIGESEIQRQVKIAYKKATEEQQLSSQLHYLFQKSLNIGKQVRSTFGSWKQEFSLEDVIVEKIYAQFSFPLQESVLLIGNSQTNRKLLRLITQLGFNKVSMITRSVGNLLQGHEALVALLTREFLSTWDQYSVVISATHQLDNPLTLQNRELKKTRLVFDLSLPRTVHPSINQQAGTTLYNIEDLGNMFQEKKERFKQDIQAAEGLLRSKIANHYANYHTKLLKKDILGANKHIKC